MNPRLFVSGSLVSATNDAMIIPDIMLAIGAIVYLIMNRLNGIAIAAESCLYVFFVIAVIHGVAIGWAIHKSQHVVVENINRNSSKTVGKSGAVDTDETGVTADMVS